MRFSSYTAVGAFAALASAQTFTDCDPTKKDCPNDPGMAASFNTDFKAGASAVKGWKQTAGSLSYNSEGAQFVISKKGESPTIQSETNLFFGTVEVKAKAAPGQGIISSIVLQSADLDEVDWEFIGGDNTNVQMNYFGKGNTTVYDRMIKGPVSNTQEMHTYTLDWSSDALTWMIDGAAVRTLKYSDAVGGKNFPQTPCNVRIGSWAAGDSEDKGTVEWAGGKTDYSKAPFTMTIESVKITNKNPGKEYKWTDKTGSWQSIEVVGKGESAPQNSVVLSASASASGSGLAQTVHATGTAAGTGSGSGSVPQSTGAPYTNGTETEPCECEGGVKTVTVIGYPPSSAPASTVAPVQSSSLPAPPVTVVPGSTNVAPTAPGIQTDTAPAPSAPGYPTAPTGALPAKNGTLTSTATPPPFTGAASHNQVGAFAGLFAAVLLMV